MDKTHPKARADVEKQKAVGRAIQNECAVVVQILRQGEFK